MAERKEAGMGGVNVDPPHIRAQLATPRITEQQIEGGHPAECVYCGSRQSLAAIWKRNPRAVSCCPERAMRFPREPNDHDMEWMIHV